MKGFKLSVILCCWWLSSALAGDDQAYQYYPKEPALEAYLNKMPWQYYRLYNVPTLGWFWVDDARDCIKDTLKQGVLWEKHVLRELKRYLRHGDVAIDIGAHMGTLSLFMSRLVGPTGTVHAFEGERQLFRELIENVRLNERPNIIPYMFWISDVEKDIEASWVFYHPDSSPVCTSEGLPYSLHVHRLDSFNFDRVKLIKIDVELKEDEVLMGARETIMRCRPIILIEIMGGFGWRVTPDVRARIDHTVSLLKGMGYVVKQIFTDDYIAIPSERFKPIPPKSDVSQNLVSGLPQVAFENPKTEIQET